MASIVPIRPRLPKIAWSEEDIRTLKYSIDVLRMRVTAIAAQLGFDISSHATLAGWHQLHRRERPPHGVTDRFSKRRWKNIRAHRESSAPLGRIEIRHCGALYCHLAQSTWPR